MKGKTWTAAVRAYEKDLADIAKREYPSPGARATAERLAEEKLAAVTRAVRGF